MPSEQGRASLKTWYKCQIRMAAGLMVQSVRYNPHRLLAVQIHNPVLLMYYLYLLVQ